MNTHPLQLYFYILLLSFLYSSCSKEGDSKREVVIDQVQYCIAYDSLVNASISKAISEGHRTLSAMPEDTTHCTKADILQKLGEANYYQGNFDISIVQLSNAAFLHDQQEMPLKKAYDLYLLSQNYLDQGYINKAEQIASDALSGLEEFNETLVYARLLNILGKCYRHTGDFDASLEMFNSSLNIAEKINDLPTIGMNLNELGVHFYQNVFYAEALEYHFKALKIFESQREEIDLIHTHYHLARVYQRLGEYDKSKILLEEALQKSSMIGVKKETSNLLKSLGSRSKAMQKYEEALTFYERALVIAKEINFKIGIGKNLNNIGNILSAQGDYSEAQHRFTEALQVYESINYVKGILECKVDLGKLYLDRKLYAQAAATFEECFPLLEKGGDNHTLAENLLFLSNAYTLEQDYKAALQYQSLYSELSQQLFNKQNSKHIALQEVTFETEKKEGENRLLRAENEVKSLQLYKKNNLILTTVIVSLLFAIIAVVIYSRFLQKNKLNTQLTKLNDQLEQANQQLHREVSNKDKFFAIIAHELRNPLWWFRSVTKVLSEKFDTMSKKNLMDIAYALDESAQNAYHLTENLLQWSKSKLGRLVYQPVEVDIHALVDTNYHLFQLQIDQKQIEVRNEVAEEVSVLADAQMMETVIRNLISNALKYTGEGGMVTISSKYMKDSRLQIIVQDTGDGIKEKHLQKILDSNYEFSNHEESDKKSSGLGLKLCVEFIRMHHSKISIRNRRQGLQIKFALPIYVQQEATTPEAKVVDVNS